MRLYKLAANGAGLGTGLSPLQVVEDGRVKQVQITFVGVGAAGADNGTVMVGTQSVDEQGVATGSPTNFAYCSIVEDTLNGKQVNVSYPVDVPVARGDMLMLNFAWSVNTFQFDIVDVLVFVQ